jgi:hypothetical protein
MTNQTERGAMAAISFAEKTTWVYGAVTLVTYGIYVGIILTRANGGPLADVAYAGPMLGAIGGAIVAGIIASTLITTIWAREGTQQDERDTAIDRYGDVIGYWVSSVGVVGALLLTMADFDRFWIANAIYLAYVLAALVSTAAKLIAHRRGFAPW